VTERLSRRLLALLLVFFLLVGLTYAVVTPCLEGSDEWSHLSLVRYYATHRSLPPPVIPPRRAATGADMAWFLEYHDPPLYYAPPLYHWLASRLIFWTDMDDLPSLMVPNPNWARGWPPEPDGTPWNKNLYVHQAEETWAQSGTVRATYALRLVSLCLGGVVVWSAYALARLLWPDRSVLALGAAILIACNPKFVSVSAGVTNDSLLNALFSLFLAWGLGGMRDGATWRRWAGLGAVAGLALLTKQSGAILLPLGLLMLVWQRGEGGWLRRKNLVSGGAFLLAALAVGGWWYGRNAILYGDPLGLQPHLASQVPLTHFGLSSLATIARSYWAAFGWAPILAEPPVYGAAALVLAAGVLGMVLRAGELRRASWVTQRGLVVLGLAFVLNLFSLFRWAVVTGAPVGRLLFPTLPAVAVWLAWGLGHWWRVPLARWGLLLAGLLGLLFVVIVPWRYLRPAYASPRLTSSLPDRVEAVDLTFQNGILLVGYEPLTKDLWAGDDLSLTLYWRVEEELGRRYRVWVQVGPQDPTHKVADQDVWLGGTLYPSEFWRAGDTVRQVHSLSIAEWSPAPALYWIRVGLVDEGTGERLRLADFDGDMVVLGPWRMRSADPPPSPTCATNFRLGEVIRLVGYDLEGHEEAIAGQGARVQLTLYWQAEGILQADYTVYVHLLDGDGELLEQDDGPPQEGMYPTSWWLPGQVVVDQHVIHLPVDRSIADAAQLRIGMYHPATLLRLPVYDGAGQRLPNDAILLPGPAPDGVICEPPLSTAR